MQLLRRKLSWGTTDRVYCSGAVVGSGAKIGDLVELGPRSRVSAGAEIGNSSKIARWVIIGPGAHVGSHVEIGPLAWIGDQAEIADNAKIDPRVEVEKNAKIGNQDSVIGKRTAGATGPAGSRGFQQEAAAVAALEPKPPVEANAAMKAAPGVGETSESSVYESPHAQKISLRIRSITKAQLEEILSSDHADEKLGKELGIDKSLLKRGEGEALAKEIRGKLAVGAPFLVGLGERALAAIAKTFGLY